MAGPGSGGRSGRLAPGENIVEVIVRGQALGGQHVDGTIDRDTDYAILLVHPTVCVQNVIFVRPQLLQLLVRRYFDARLGRNHGAATIA